MLHIFLPTCLNNLFLFSVNSNAALQLVDDELYKELLRVQSELQKSERFCLRCVAQLEGRPVSASSATDSIGPSAETNILPSHRAQNVKSRYRSRSNCKIEGVHKAENTDHKSDSLRPFINNNIDNSEVPDTRPIYTVSKTWKIVVEVKMEDLLCLMKTKLPLHCASPTLFRRRFRALFSLCFEHADIAQTSGNMWHFRKILLDHSDFIVWSAPFFSNIKCCVATVSRGWEESKHDGQFNVQKHEKSRSRLNDLKAIYDSTSAMSDFLNSESTGDLAIRDKVVIVSVISQCIYNLESDLLTTFEADELQPIIHSCFESDILKRCRHRDFERRLALKDTSGVDVVIDSKYEVVCAEDEWSLFSAVLQCLFSVDEITIYKALNPVRNREFDPVLLLCFLYIVRSCRDLRSENCSDPVVSKSFGDVVDEPISAALFVDWLVELFEPLLIAANSLDIVVTGTKNQMNLVQNKTVDDMLLQQFFDMYAVPGIFFY